MFLYLLRPRQRLPPRPQKIHLSATNGPRLLKFSVHLSGITPGCFWTYCDRASGCRPAPIADGRKLLNCCMHFIWITYVQKASIYQFKSLRQKKARPSMFYFKSIYIWKKIAPLAIELGDGLTSPPYPPIARPSPRSNARGATFFSYIDAFEVKHGGACFLLSKAFELVVIINQFFHSYLV